MIARPKICALHYMLLAFVAMLKFCKLCSIKVPITTPRIAMGTHRVT